MKRIHHHWMGKGWVRTVAGTVLGIAISLSAPWVVQAVTSPTGGTISATPAAEPAAGVAPLFPVSETTSSADPAENGARVLTGESPQDWFKVFGSATLVNGVATIHLEPVFGPLASAGLEYQVYFSPKRGLQRFISRAQDRCSLRSARTGPGDIEHQLRVSNRGTTQGDRKRAPGAQDGSSRPSAPHKAEAVHSKASRRDRQRPGRQQSGQQLPSQQGSEPEPCW